MQFDELQSAKRALYAGRDARGAPVDVPLVVSYTKDAVQKFAARIDKRLYRPARDSVLRISLRKVRVTHSKRGRDINQRELVKGIGAALSTRTLNRVLKPHAAGAQAEGDRRQAAQQRVDGHHDRAAQRSSCACSST